MTKKERQKKANASRASQVYKDKGYKDAPTAVRFTESNLMQLNELSQKTGYSRNKIINAMVSHAFMMETGFNIK